MYPVEYYSAIKDEIPSFSGKQRELLIKIGQTQRNKYHMFPSHAESRPKNKQEDIKRRLLRGDDGKGRQEW
jgi:hypothetical protein